MRSSSEAVAHLKSAQAGRRPVAHLKSQSLAERGEEGTHEECAGEQEREECGHGAWPVRYNDAVGHEWPPLFSSSGGGDAPGPCHRDMPQPAEETGQQGAANFRPNRRLAFSFRKE